MTWAWRALKDAVAARLLSAGDTTPHYLGTKWLDANHAPPRYVWVMRTDAPDKRISKVDTNPPALYGMMSSVSIHCWGQRFDLTESDEKDFDAAYTLSGNVLTALREECLGNLHLAVSGFLDPQREGWIRHGQCYLLNISLLVPRVAAIEPTQEIMGGGLGISAVFPNGDYTVI